MRLIKNRNDMTLVGQGGKIALFALPALLAAILIHQNAPGVAALPEALSFLRPLGYVLLWLGNVLWAVALYQLRTGFPQGKLVTNGAYGVVRNPIYSSAALGVLPGISLITLTWVYLVVALFLYVGVLIFIGREEQHLAEVFGQEYADYRARVSCMIPFRKPASGAPAQPHGEGRI